MDGVGAMNGLLDGPAIVALTPPTTKYTHTFHVPTPKPQVGIYKLVVTISHSPNGNPNQLTEMFGFAESTPINIRQTVVEIS
jgi:hypothetical protein